MGSVWKRLQRVNKRAAKFQFTASYHELQVETTAKWRPTNLSVVWTRRSRRVASTPLPWEPDMMNPLVGRISWPVPDNHTISVTLFKDARTHELEDKDWTFVIEDISQLGKKRILASASINMRKYASIESTQQSFTLSLRPISRKISSADLELTISCVFLREGKATDEDMQSVVSLMSVNNNCDVAPLDDLEDIPDLESSGDISEHVLDFTHQLEQLTSSLNGGYVPDIATPMSVPSLSEDPTPLAESSHLYFDLEFDKPLDKGKSPISETASSDTTTTTQAQPDISLTSITEENKTKQHQNIEAENINKIVENNNKQTITNHYKHRNTDELDKTIVKKSLQNIDEIKYNFSKPLLTEQKSLSPFNIKILEEKIEVIVSETEKHVSSDKETKENIEIKLVENDKSIAAVDEKLQIPSVSLPVSVTQIETQTQTQITNQIRPNTQVQKPIMIEKRQKSRPELQPLNLKKNYENNDNSSSNNKIIDKLNVKERTPGQDLLEWCKEVTKDYPNIKVTNLTTSWRNGMAFCAIIHYFEPELIEMTKLSPHDVVGNCRMAFDVAESLGIPRVIEPRDMNLLAVPDKLAVMTYLHQLRAHFTGKQLQIEQIGPTSDESSYVIGNYKSDNLSQNILNLSHLKAHLQQQNSLDNDNSENRSPTHKKDVRNLIISGSKNLLGKVLSPTKDKNINGLSQIGTMNQQQQQRNNESTISMNSEQNGENNLINNETKEKPLLMTRRELVDPFGSDDEDTNFENSPLKHNQDQQQSQDSFDKSPTLDPSATLKILIRHKQMSEQAKALREKLKTSSIDNKKNKDIDRQKRLRDHARRLIAETRLAQIKDGQNSPNSPTTTTGTKHNITEFITERTISPIHQSPLDEYVFNQTILNGSDSPSKLMKNHFNKISPIKVHTNNIGYNDNKKLSSIIINDDNNLIKTSNSNRKHEKNGNNSPLQSFNSVLDRISPKIDKKGDKLSYIESEMEALEREQEAIDQKASSLEKKLRAVMGGNSKTEETEEQLLSQWFTLVNKKNALIRRQMQLNILEQENDLERKYALLNQELRAALSVEDWRKSEEQRERESLLLAELVAIVDKRDQLVQHLHSQEKAIEDDDEIERELEHVDISAKDKCIIQ